jgi:hypothetical protein
LTNKNSSGFDGISIKLVKKLTPVITEPLSAIANKSFQLGIFPRSCKAAKIIPELKSGDEADYKN